MQLFLHRDLFSNFIIYAMNTLKYKNKERGVGGYNKRKFNENNFNGLSFCYLQMI